MVQLDIQQKKTPRKGWVTAAIIFIAAVIFTVLFFMFYPFASTEKESYFDGNMPILFQGKQVGNGVSEGELIYVPISFLKKYIDEDLFYDEKSNSIIITTKDKVVQMPTESLTYYVNEGAVNLHFPPLKTEEGELFIALEPILSFYPFEYSLLPETEAVSIKKDGEEITKGKTKEARNEKWLRLRTEPSLRSPYTAELTAGERVYIEGEKEDYYYVRKENGIAGYVKQQYITEGETETVSVQIEEKPAPTPNFSGPVQLTWEAVYSRNPDPKKIPPMPGVNVVSPTWFKLLNKDGAIHNLGSLEYVKWAREQGYQVWALFSNNFDPDLTRSAFRDFETRQKMIRELLHYSQIYDLDGINIDIENVYPEDGPLVTQFVREATPYFHEAGLIVSMDITFIAGGNWSAFYERDKLAEIVDYLIVMAYDEHWSTSPVAGSVASLPWVEKNLQKLLKVVPHEKLILGVPLYTRLWSVTDAGEVSSRSMSMEAAQQWLVENDLQPIYDQESGQNYAELYVPEEKVTYKIWLEDELSLAKRAEIAKNYNLAGVASWSRYFADENAWTTLNLAD